MNAGRKRSFDKEEALDKAMRVFWENGYAGTSLADLTSELGINKPSLYSAFGNKEKLFESSLQHYMANYAQAQLQNFDGALDDSSGASFKERLTKYLYNLIDSHTNSQTPKGCFFVKSCNEAGSVAMPEAASVLLDDMGKMIEEAVDNLLDAEQEAGTIAKSTSLAVASNYLLTTMFGLAVQARRGKDKKDLQEVADFAVEMFPA